MLVCVPQADACGGRGGALRGGADRRQRRGFGGATGGVLPGAALLPPRVQPSAAPAVPTLRDGALGPPYSTLYLPVRASAGHEGESCRNTQILVRNNALPH